MIKKYVQLFVVLVLVVTVIGVARNNAVWASAIPGSPQLGVSGMANLLQSGPVTVTASGSYNVEGVCTLDVEYKAASGLQDKADARIPVNESKKVPFSGNGNEKLIFPGCHVVHYKSDQIVSEASAEDGSWKVCFGTNPSLDMKIYYYLDGPTSGSPIWIPLKTTNENGAACASALFTGVYMPAGQRINPPGAGEEGNILNPPAPEGGSVKPPPDEITVTKSGTYAIGGICAMIIEYKIADLSDRIHVQHPTEANDIVPFPDNGGMLYLPGCHVAHYKLDQIKQLMTSDEGRWEICFAARPDKEMTIYFYQDDLTTIIPPWVPLETTVDKGLACAPLADYSGVYAPAGK
ncbi:MAG: hypothetical protein HY863_19845 [Chloroflexi bacterium]|nr:hypothetical protein [Chloroflexota bacterium]